MVNFSKIFSRKNLYSLTKNAVRDHQIDRMENVINIGAGGEIADTLRGLGLKFKEVDVDPDRAPDFLMSMEDMQMIPDNSVDAVFCLEVLEHVKNPFLAVRETKRILKPGGILVGSTPFLFPIHDSPNDFYRYTEFGINNLFIDFKKSSLVRRNSYLEAIFVCVLRLINIGSFRERLLIVVIFPVLLLSFLVIVLLNYVVINDSATTGYFYVFQNIE